MSEESLDLMLRVLLGDDTVRKFESGMITMEQALEGVDEKSVKLAQTFAEELDRGLKDLDAQFDATKKRLDAFKQSAEKLGKISQTMLVASSAVVGAIYLSAKTEADRIIEAGGEVDAVTQRWIAANEKIEQSQQRVGRVAESAVVPLLEQAAALAEKAADFVEKNPDLVSAALKLGVWVAGISAIGVAVSKGIRMYADVAYLQAAATQSAAAAMMKSAAEDQLRAALGQKGGSPVTPAAGAGGAGKVGQVVGTIALAAATAYVTVQTVNWVLDKLDQPRLGEMFDAELGFLKKLPEVFSGDIKINDLAAQMVNLAIAEKDARKETDGFVEAVTYVTEKEAEGKKILKKLAEDEAAAERKYADDRESILIDSARALADANRDLDSSLSAIAESLASNISKIRSDLTDTLAGLSADFTEANLQAEREYQQQRADIIANGEAEIARIQQQAQKDLEDLEREHARNVAGIVGERDALALANENQNYSDRKSEIEQNAQMAIEQARANTEAQLAEAARNYEEQRAQRLAEYEKQKAEAKAQAEQAIAEARAKAAEEKKQAEEKYKEQQEDIARKQTQQLEDLRRQAENERRERVIAANQSIVDLNGALNAEAELRRKYYDIMLSDANNFMSSYSSALSSSTTTSAGPAPKSSSSLSASSASPLRALVGNKLTQDTMIQAAGGDGAVVWNDYRRFEADVSLSTRNAIKDDTLRAIESAMQAAKRRR